MLPHSRETGTNLQYCGPPCAYAIRLAPNRWSHHWVKRKFVVLLRLILVLLWYMWGRGGCLVPLLHRCSDFVLTNNISFSFVCGDPLIQGAYTFLESIFQDISRVGLRHVAKNISLIFRGYMMSQSIQLYSGYSSISEPELHNLCQSPEDVFKECVFCSSKTKMYTIITWVA